MAPYFVLIVKKNQEEKHHFESKEFKKLKPTDRKTQREKFSKDKWIFYPMNTVNL